jgi:hypothetical protein
MEKPFGDVLVPEPWVGALPASVVRALCVTSRKKEARLFSAFAQKSKRTKGAPPSLVPKLDANGEIPAIAANMAGAVGGVPTMWCARASECAAFCAIQAEATVANSGKSYLCMSMRNPRFNGAVDAQEDSPFSVEDPTGKGSMFYVDVDCKHIKGSAGESDKDDKIPNTDGATYPLSHRSRLLGKYLSALMLKITKRPDLSRCLVAQRTAEPETLNDNDPIIKFCLHLYFPFLFVDAVQRETLRRTIVVALYLISPHHLAGIELNENHKGYAEMIDPTEAIRSFTAVKPQQCKGECDDCKSVAAVQRAFNQSSGGPVPAKPRKNAHKIVKGSFYGGYRVTGYYKPSVEDETFYIELEDYNKQFMWAQDHLDRAMQDDAYMQDKITAVPAQHKEFLVGSWLLTCCLFECAINPPAVLVADGDGESLSCHGYVGDAPFVLG